MALTAKHKEVEFGVGDQVRVAFKIKEGEKTRQQVFEGMVIGIKGRGKNKSFTVRKIGVQQIGIERIIPLASPSIESVEVAKKGLRGVRRAKLYYTREKARKEIEEIYSRASKKEKDKTPEKPKKAKKTSKKKKKASK